MNLRKFFTCAMNELQQRIQDDLRHAFKQGEKIKVGTLRLLQAAIKNVEIEKRRKDVGLTDQEIIEVVGREVKKRREAAEMYRRGAREDLVFQEETEAAILEAYLPPRLSDEELRSVVQDVLAGGETNPGKVMGMVMAKAKGRADGGVVRKMVEEMMNVERG